MEKRYFYKDDLFESDNLSLIAVLHCFGATIECVDHSNSPHIVFGVRRERGLDQIVQAFYSHKLKIDPLDYFNALKQCKTRLYDR